MNLVAPDSNSPLRSLARALGGWTVLASAGCATLDRDVPRQHSDAITARDARDTRLGQGWAAAAPSDPSLSGFRLLPNSLEAFAARVAIIDAADRTLDLQYYIFSADDTGLFLVDRLIAAADRGVRVRILIDDMYAHGIETGLANFDAHDNIELRLFNPWTQRGGSLGRGFEFLFTPRLNHRMHNKLLVGDGTVAVFGGRNLADEYFDLNEDFEFRDLDVVAAGPVAADAGEVFDAFWNSPDAVPIAGMPANHDPSAALAAGRAQLAEHRERMRESPYADAVRSTDLVQQLHARDAIWTFAHGTVVGDAPEKTERAGDAAWTGSLKTALEDVFFSAKRELLVSSPYFVPRRRGTERLCALAENGVQVKIITNSLAANDVPLVHASYSRYRPRLVREGVELFELRRRGAVDPDKPERAFGSANASLHAKTFVVDRERVFIGSMNLDPRSVALNTEIGVLIDSLNQGQPAPAPEGQKRPSQYHERGSTGTSREPVEGGFGGGLDALSDAPDGPSEGDALPAADAILYCLCTACNAKGFSRVIPRECPRCGATEGLKLSLVASLAQKDDR